MKRVVLMCLLASSAACVDPLAAEAQFCAARPELCGSDAGDDAGADAGCPRNDEFDGPTWNGCFTVFDATSSTPPARLENGVLVFDQRSGNQSWSNGNTGSLLSQEVTGNFVAEVSARLVPFEDGGRPGVFTAAVLLAVDPSFPQTNNRLVSVGTLGGSPDGGAPDYGVLSEVTPRGGVTDYRGVGTGSSQAMIRLCRVGTAVHAYYRLTDAGTWNPFPPLSGADAGVLPDRVLVGPGAYNVAGPTARVEHDWFRLSAAVTSQLDCSLTLP